LLLFAQRRCEKLFHVVQCSNSELGLLKTAQAHREEIVLATTANFDNLAQAF